MASFQQNNFVEDDFSQPMMDPREAAKLIAKQRQEMIAGELSRLDADEYLDNILEHLHQLEEELLPDANLIDMQREIQWYMRPYLIDFIVEAHQAFSLLPETLFLAVNLLDRYCSKRVVYKQHYQLVGCASLLIAAKYGDKKDRVPQISELNNMCCGLYDAGMFTQMETHVLNTLDWMIGFPTVDVFHQLQIAEHCDNKQVENLAGYISEIALYHRDFVSTKPSVMARASLALSRAVLGLPEVMEPEWDDGDNTVRLALSQALHQPSATLSRKYTQGHYDNVATILKEFLAQQVAIARRAAQPPTPPAEQMVQKHQADIYSTPHKGHAVPGIADGYMTPPITPEGALEQSRGVYAPHQARCPVTPTFQSVQPHANFVQHHQQHVFQPQVQNQPYSYPTHMDIQ